METTSKTQHRFRTTKLVSELRNKTYPERLSILDMFSVEYRILRGDLIETYKIINQIDRIDIENFFHFKSNSITRGHSLSLVKPRANSDIRKYSFSNRIVNEWNKLPEQVVCGESLGIFKRRLDQGVLVEIFSLCTGSDYIKVLEARELKYS